MYAQDGARVVAGGAGGRGGGGRAGRAKVGGGLWRSGTGGAHVCARGGDGGLRVRVPRIAVHDLACGVEGLNLNVLVQVGDGVEVAVGGDGAVGGLERGGGAGDEGAEGEVVEDVAAVAPDVCAAVLAQTLVVEAIDGRDLARLVVPADQRQPVRVADFEAEEEEEGLERVEAAVDKVACAARLAGERGRWCGPVPMNR